MILNLNSPKPTFCIHHDCGEHVNPSYNPKPMAFLVTHSCGCLHKLTLHCVVVPITFPDKSCMLLVFRPFFCPKSVGLTSMAVFGILVIN